MENAYYRWMPFKLREYHSSGFEDIIAFSAFDKNDLKNKNCIFLKLTVEKQEKSIVYHKHSYSEKYIY